MLAVIATCILIWQFSSSDRASIAAQARFSSITFAIIVAIQALLALGALPTLIGPAIAVEREKKSLDALLTTQLSNAEIVLGITFSGLVKVWSSLLVAFAIEAVMSPLWGIDPKLVLLTNLGLLAASYFVAGMSAVAAVEGRTPRRAVTLATGMWAGWLGLPTVIIFLLPRIWSWGATWLAPVVRPVLDSSPMVVLLALGGVLGRGSFVETIWRLIGLDLAAGTFLLLWAVVRLRRASRAAYDNETLALIHRLPRPMWRRRRRPCGDDPILWQEMHKTRYKTPFDWLLGNLIGLVLLLAYVVPLWWVAKPAFREVRELGYAVSGQRIPSPEFHPFVRWAVLGAKSSPLAGQARAELNTVVRQATAAFYVIFLLLTSAFAAESIVSERERDTWSGLLATPLSGPAILRAKMLGVLWRNRWYIGPTVGAWLLALAAGAVHPLGLIASFVVLLTSTCFFSSLGVYAAMVCTKRDAAMNLAVLPALVLAFSGVLVFILPPRGATILMGAGSMPVVGWLSLVSFDDVAIAAQNGSFPRLRIAGISTGEGAFRVFVTWLIAVCAQTAAAYFLTRAAFCDFDMRVGRPVRSSASGRLAGTEPPAQQETQLAVIG